MPARVCFVFVSLVCLCFIRLAAEESVQYDLQPLYEGPRLKALQIEIGFTANIDGVTYLQLPNRWASASGLWRNVRNLKVQGADQVSGERAERRITSAGAAKLSVSYEIWPGVEGDLTTVGGASVPHNVHMTPDWFYTTGHALFATPRGRERSTFRVAWHGFPENFVFVSSLEDKWPEPDGVYRRVTMRTLLESGFLAGRDVQQESIPVGSSVLRVAWRGNYDFSVRELATAAGQTLRAQRDFWGEVDSPFLILLGPTLSSPGRTSLGGSALDGCFVLGISEGVKLDSVMPLLEHENLHTWIPRQMGGLLEGPLEATSYWFSEGFTVYYTATLPYRRTPGREEAWLAAWNELLKENALSSVRNKKNSEIPKAFWSDPETKRLPYHRGAILALIWDTRLRRNSSGQKNLDDIMRAHYAAVKTGLYSGLHAAEIFPLVAEQFGLDISEDIARYIEDGETPPLAELSASEDVELVSVEFPAYDRGYDPLLTERAGNRMVGVRDGSAAHQAGLRNGMVFLWWESGRIGDPTVDHVIRIKNDENAPERSLRYKPQGEASLGLPQLRFRRATPPTS